MPSIVKKWLLCIIVLAALVALLGCGDKAARSAALAASLEKQYGLRIVKLATAEQLPRATAFQVAQGEIVVEMTPPTAAQYINYLKIIEVALAKYPVDLVRKHIKKIGIGGPYMQNGGVTAGMYDREALYLFYNHPRGDNSDIFLEQTIHHEFSSILIYQYDFPAFDWLKLNPKEFDYIISPAKIDAYMNSIKSYGANPELLRQGLVSSYGRANAENDINTYVELIFTQPKKIKKYLETYPRTIPKYEMIKRFYLSVSPEFSIIFNAVR